MNMNRLRPGDHVQCNVRGRVFTATFEGIEPEGTRPVRVVPDDTTKINHYRLTKREVTRRLRRPKS